MTAHTITEALQHAEEAQIKHPKGPRRSKSTDTRLKQLTPEQSAAAVAPYRTAKPVAEDRRPYTLESANLEADLARQRDAALSELEAIDAAIGDIQLRAERDRNEIQARADIEIKARRQRGADLGRILQMVDRALNVPTDDNTTTKPPRQTEASTQEELAAQIEAQRQGDLS